MATSALVSTFNVPAFALIDSGFHSAAVIPVRVLLLFGFGSTTPGLTFLLGAFGTVYATMGIGYIFAARSPMRNIAWIQVAIARGTAESLFSLYCVATGMVTFVRRYDLVTVEGQRLHSEARTVMEVRRMPSGAWVSRKATQRFTPS